MLGTAVAARAGGGSAAIFLVFLFITVSSSVELQFEDELEELLEGRGFLPPAQKQKPNRTPDSISMAGSHANQFEKRTT